MTQCLIEDKVLIEKVYPFQVGGFCFVSFFLEVLIVSSPIVTYNQQFILPNVLVFLRIIVWSNLKFNISGGSSMN